MNFMANNKFLVFDKHYKIIFLNLNLNFIIHHKENQTQNQAQNYPLQHQQQDINHNKLKNFFQTSIQSPSAQVPIFQRMENHLF